MEWVRLTTRILRLVEWTRLITLIIESNGVGVANNYVFEGYCSRRVLQISNWMLDHAYNDECKS